MATESLTDALKDTLSVFEESGAPRTTTEVAERLDLGRRSAYDRLDRLVDRGQLETKKVGAAGRVWWQPASTSERSSGDSAGSGRVRGSDREQLESLIDAVEDYAIFVLDRDGYVRSWNPGVERIKGYEAEEIVGEHFSTFYTDADREAGVPGENLAAADAEGSIEDEGWRVRADGSRFWANVTITAIRGDDGDLQGYAKVTRDMTERREYERRLSAQADRLQRQRDDLERELDDMFERVDDAFYALDEEFRFEYVNERAGEYFGASESELLGRVIWEALETDEDDPIIERFETAIATQEPASFERYSEPLGLWTNTRVYPGESGLSVYFTDITERKEREQELQLYETIVETVRDGVYVIDDDYRFVRVNGAYAEMTGYDREELLGAHSTLVVDDEVSDESARHVERILAGEAESASIEADLVRADGSRLRAESNFTAIEADEAGGPLKVGVVRDVSERVARERELEESEQRYRTLVENFPNGIVTLFDEDFRYLVAGGELYDAFDVAPEGTIGKTLYEHRHPEEVTLLEPYYEAALEGESHSFETEYEGRTIRIWTVPVTDESGDVFAGMAMSQDVTEQRERERDLRDRVRQQEVVTDLGRRALATHDLDELLAGAAELVAETLDNDYCKVLDLDADAEELLLRRGVGWDDGIVGTATVSSVEADSQAAYTLESERPVRVEDLEDETRFSGPDLLTSHDVRSGISTIIGSPDDPWGILGTHDTDSKTFSEHDVYFVQSVANILASAIDRHEHERERDRQRMELAALNSLNVVFRDITDAVIEQSTREEIETAVCEGLTLADSFSFAWIGEVDPATQTLEPRVEAGTEGYVDGMTVSVDPEDERSQGPGGQAYITGEVQIARDTQTDEEFAPWRDRAESHYVRSSAAVPIAYDDRTYGVLNVYAGRPGAFATAERRVLGQLGEVVGHAIAAVERKRALMSDEIVELEFLLEDAFSALGVDATSEGRITLDQAVPTSGEEFLVYGTATEAARPALDELVDALAHWKGITDLGVFERRHRFELRVSEPPVLSTVAARGGYVESVRIEDGDAHLVAHLPTTANVREIVDVVDDAYPAAELLANRQISRTGEMAARLERLLEEGLTERQRSALEVAFHTGFFEWPRETSGEEVAASLGVSPPTFHQHLRKAERKVLQSVLSATAPG